MKITGPIGKLSGMQLLGKTVPLVLLALLLFNPFAFASSSKKAKQVLVLCSFESHLPMYEIEIPSIRSTLESAATGRIILYVEYMDTARFTDDRYFQQMIDFYRQKYPKGKIDLLICVDEPALDFILLHGDELFSQVPKVFCAISKRYLKTRTLKSEMTGVVVDLDIRGTREMALNIQPETRRVVVVSGTSQIARFFEEVTRRVVRGYENKIEFIYLCGLPMEDILKKVANLPKHTIVFYLWLFQDGSGTSYVPRDVAALLSRKSNAPVYGLFDTFVGHGIVGGRVASFGAIGALAGKLGLRILDDEKPADLPIIEEDTLVYMFDWRQLKRWGIRERDLPPGSIVRHKEPSFWNLYVWHFTGTIALCVIEALLIAFLLTSRKRHRQAEERLRETEFQFRTVADFTYDWEYWANFDGTLRYVSPSCKRISGYEPEQFIDNPPLFRDIIVPEDREIWDKHYHDSRSWPEPRELQFRIRRRDGETRWIEHACQPVRGGEGELLGFRASNRDITERKLIEESLQKSQEEFRILAGRLLKAQESERRKLAREMHDDMTQRLAFLAIEAGKLEQRWQDMPDPVPEKLREIREHLVKLSVDVHKISRQLHPSIIEDLGLVDAIESECTNFSHREGINVNYMTRGIPADTPQDIALCIYRIVQEGLRNVAKHAQATEAHISLISKDDQIHVTIKDNGKGFDLENVKNKPGLGLASMEERVRLIRGHLSVQSQPGYGTVIEAKAPLSGRK
ncbi:MAG: PAS domain S-box protein [Deltaproteobacteria bacterium]|nr:PAS domain S-box protein [Deltaproteobacteria bacterium]